MANPRAMRLWHRLSGSAIGRRLFSTIVCWQAPYFGSIRPRFEVLESGRAVASVRKRRAVTNHIGTVHAIAMANLCELVAGTVTEVSIPATMRWIPRGMQIDYLQKATTDVRAEANLPSLTAGVAQDLVVPVDVIDSNGRLVVHADITMYVSPR
ncbi:MAG: hotdog fold domain-containing protein [Pseudomonadota bacterium]